MSARAQVDPGALAADLRLLAEVAARLAGNLESSLASLGRGEAGCGRDGNPGATGEPAVNLPDGLLDAEALSGLLGIDARTLRRWRAEGRCPAPLKRVGRGRPRWSRAAVARWIARRAP